METKQKGRKVVLGVLALAALLAFSLLAMAGNLEPSAPPAPTMKTLDEVEPRVPIHSAGPITRLAVADTSLPHLLAAGTAAGPFEFLPPAFSRSLLIFHFLFKLLHKLFIQFQ